MSIVAIFKNIDPWKKAVEDQQDLLPVGFSMTADGGTWYQNPGDDKARPFKLCDAVVVRARVCDPDGGEWGRIIEYRSPRGAVAMRMVTDETLHDTPRNLAKDLAGTGLWIETSAGAHTQLQKLLNNVNVEINVYTKQCGWTKNTDGQEVFALPSGEIIGAGVILRPDCCNVSCLPSGTLEEWQEDVAKYAVGNSRFILSMCAQFAAPLLKDSGMISGGFHFYGGSQIAKTTVVLAGCSAIGRPSAPPSGVLSSWNSTANAMEGTASRANDCALPMDEMSQAQPNDVARIVYALGNGAGKGRMRADSTMRSTYTWRTTIVSTGEEKAEDVMAKAHQRVNAGVDVRLANVPADAGVGHGVFEELHGFPDFNALARHLCDKSRKRYGTALREFIIQYCALRNADKDETMRDVNSQCDQWVRDNVPYEAAGQVKAVARRFALCAVAGELATLMGILPWPQGTASFGVKRCLEAWIEDRGDVGMAEDKRIIVDLQRYLTANQYNRFIDADVTEFVKVQELVGVKKPSVAGDWKSNEHVAKDFYIFANQWSNVMPGVNAKIAMKVLKKAGLLITDETRTTFKIRMVWKGTSHLVYRISNKIFEYGE